jgi:hypothetical protein
MIGTLGEDCSTKIPLQVHCAYMTESQHKGLALALSCVSAAAAETATYPIDAIKTQLQLQHGTSRSVTNSSSTPAAGAGQLARQVLQKNGLSGLYAGLSPAVLRHIFYTGVLDIQCATAGGCPGACKVSNLAAIIARCWEPVCHPATDAHPACYTVDATSVAILLAQLHAAAVGRCAATL